MHVAFIDNWPWPQSKPDLTYSMSQQLGHIQCSQCLPPKFDMEDYGPWTESASHLLKAINYVTKHPDLVVDRKHQLCIKSIR